MKNKWKWVYNPFEFLAGWNAFGIGIVILCITTIVGYFGYTVFYALEIKSVPNVTWNMAFSLQFSGLAVTVVIMYVTALLFAKGVRFQDLLGTVTLAKYPLLLMALFSLPFGKKIASIDINKFITMEFTISDILPLMILGIISIILLTWEVVLLFNAFRVSTNLKGVKCAGLFVAALLITEIVTVVLVFLFMR